MVTALRAQIERRLQTIDGLVAGESMYGHGRAYWANGKEAVHFESDSVVEIRLTRAVIRERRAALKTDERVMLRPHTSDWIAVRFVRPADVDFVIELAERSAEAHRPAAGVAAKPPPSGADLRRRQRFH